MLTPPILYTIHASNPTAHLFEVSCHVEAPDTLGQQFALPAWIPGSYLIRDFARHIVSISAESDGKPVRLTKTDKHTWQAAPLKSKQALTLRYVVYAWDLSVRGAHLDQTHGFFNGTSVFLRVIGHESTPCLVELVAPKGKNFKQWRVATTLEPSPKSGNAAAAKLGFGRYAAANYDELIDHPVEMGTFTLAKFKACGVPHEIAITGQHDCDLERLTADLTKICEWQIQFFGKPAPMKKFLFLVTAVGEGYGGLEHRASTALICSRDDLPYAGMSGLPERYQSFLGLCSHEYFHTWNVKRIKPAAFTPYDLNRENHTTLLWAFEGFTSYYDDLVLLRAGIINEKDWLALTEKTIDNVLRAPGRLQQSLAESSFDAWSKYYRQDENSPNSIVSYYTKGALLALALDLALRAGTQGKVSLDDVMRTLWQRHGLTNIGVGEQDIQLLAEELSGLKLKSFFANAVEGTQDLPLAKLLKPFGIKLKREASSKQAALGAKLTNEGDNFRLATVFTGGPSQAAGLSAGDLLVAINGLRATAKTLEQLLTRKRENDTITVHAFRRDELMSFQVRLAPPTIDKTTLIAEEENSLRKNWLHSTCSPSPLKSQKTNNQGKNNK